MMLNAQESAEAIVAEKVKGRINRSSKYNLERRKELWMRKTTKKAAHKGIARKAKSM
jgi:hypothetical protein